MFYPLKSNPVSTFFPFYEKPEVSRRFLEDKVRKKKNQLWILSGGNGAAGECSRLPPTLLCGHGSQQAPVEWGRAYPSWTQGNLPHRNPKPFQILSWKCCLLLMSLVGNLSLTIYKKMLTVPDRWSWVTDYDHCVCESREFDSPHVGILTSALDVGQKHTGCLFCS